MLEPLFDNVLVIEADVDRSLGGIELPDITREDVKFGRVVSVGREAKTIMPENLVMFGPYAGIPVVLEGVQFILMREGEIKGRIVNS